MSIEAIDARAQLLEVLGDARVVDAGGEKVDRDGDVHTVGGWPLAIEEPRR